MTQGGMNSPPALHRFKSKQFREFSPDELAFMFDDSLLGTEGPSKTKHLDLIEQFLKNCIEYDTILRGAR